MGKSGARPDRAFLTQFLSMSYPPALARIVALFESLPEDERRENLVAYAERAGSLEPRTGEDFDLEDVRKDEECTDPVGVFLKVDSRRRVTLRARLGPQVQTLTKAMTAILCKGLAGLTVEEIIELPSDFVPKIVGTKLIRIRSQAVFYVLTRIKSACKVLLKREQAGN